MLVVTASTGSSEDVVLRVLVEVTFQSSHDVSFQSVQLPFVEPFQAGYPDDKLVVVAALLEDVVEVRSQSAQLRLVVVDTVDVVDGVLDVDVDDIPASSQYVHLKLKSGYVPVSTGTTLRVFAGHVNGIEDANTMYTVPEGLTQA